MTGDGNRGLNYLGDPPDVKLPDSVPVIRLGQLTEEAFWDMSHWEEALKETQ